MFVGFYSYKGGVGRSLALANIACLMAQDKEHPQRVLVWDYDLEAPGLHRLFPPKQPQSYGFVDLAYEYAESGTIRQVREYIYESEVENVHVLPAGKVGGRYCERLQQIDWARFFGSDPKNPGKFFRDVLTGIEEAEPQYDYVLIDSRTGLNDQAGICTQVLSELLIVLFRLTPQNMDGLEYLIPATRKQLKARGKEETEILPIASQVRASVLQEQSEMRDKAIKLFGDASLEYIRFDEDLVSRERVFCVPDELRSMWPCPPIVEDYRRICARIREGNREDTKTQSRELRAMIREGDTATASTLLLRLLLRRSRLGQAWAALLDLFEGGRITESRKQDFSKTVTNILSDDPENHFAYQWKAAFECARADSPKSPELKKARSSLVKASEYAPNVNKGSIFRALGFIESIRGNHEDAIKFLRKAQMSLPKNNQINLDLAMLYMRMGAKYFALAAEELDQVQKEIGNEKYSALAYIRAFLSESNKAMEALEGCDMEFGPIVQAHMFLIQGDPSKGMELAKKEILTKGYRAVGMSNWAEFYVCAEEFDEAISLLEKASELRHDSKVQLGCLRKFAEVLKKKELAGSEESDQLINDWKKTSWNFRELLMFRECCLRNGRSYGGMLDIMEEIIQLQQLEEIKTQGVGLFKRGSVFGRDASRYGVLRRVPRL